MTNKTTIPGWFIILAVVITAGVTSWAMLQFGDLTKSPYPAAQMPAQMMPAAAMFDNNGTMVAAKTGVAPSIAAGSSPIHQDRGTCTTCHQVVGPMGAAIPMITALSQMPHQYRGVCTNCHQVISPSAQMGTVGTMVAGQMGQGVPTGTPLPINAQGQGAAEGEWLGLEVASIMPITANQYNIPPGTQGLVVVEANLQAATAGIRAGDVVVSINGRPVLDLTGFFAATGAGAATQGQVEFIRRGQRMMVGLGQNQAVPGAMGNVGMGQVQAPLPGINQGMR